MRRIGSGEISFSVDCPKRIPGTDEVLGREDLVARVTETGALQENAEGPGRWFVGAADDETRL
jgi:hypothetical protein